jgi:mRNA-degrading endonuclease HigB of HigAB toxin-antitoxin module
MKKPLFLIVALLLCNVAASAQNNPIVTDKAVTTKIVQFLEASGQGYTKAQDGIWVVKFKGNQLAEISVITFAIQDMLIFIATVAEKAEYKAAPELLQKLLLLNDNFDRIKVGIDKDGDIFTRVDLSLRLLDQKEFNANLEQMAAAADETFGVVKPFLAAPKKPVK